VETLVRVSLELIAIGPPLLLVAWLVNCSFPKRIFRVPQVSGLVRVIEQGRQTSGLCLQPLERVPDGDRMIIHKLMIEAHEETYLQMANQLTPICSSDGYD